ncbi:unnamed protein product [Rotaria socialis]|uniref:Uncharacterized protein n=2 Tax=Rotaria socialis TaxID=392032 RepID=A0A819UJF6_9BILA|nr:unnamed protein product [Rotaria socialis]
MIYTSKWKNQHGIDLTITARFGHLHSLLVFADDSSSFESFLDSSRAPRLLKDVDIEIKAPRQRPPAYSLIIQQFHRNWNEDEWLVELQQQRYVSLYKITRIRMKDGSTLNAVRVDFKTIEECLHHDRTTKSCSRPHLCPRCAEEHSLEHGWPNHERCINCDGDHISGHLACPVVQEKRHALAEQSKRQRSELLARAERQQHQYHFQGNDYPVLLNDNQSYSSTDIPHQTTESSQKSYGQGPIGFIHLGNQRERSSPKNIEYTLPSFLNKMEHRLDKFSSRLSLQLCDIDKKINVYYDGQVEMENILHETILPTIQELARVVSQSSRNRNT